MSRTGDCWDNAVVESFFATLTKELLADGTFATREDARRELGSFLEAWYNRERRHSALGFRSPVEYEEQVCRAGQLRCPRKWVNSNSGIMRPSEYNEDRERTANVCLCCERSNK